MHKMKADSLADLVTWLRASASHLRRAETNLRCRRRAGVSPDGIDAPLDAPIGNEPHQRDQHIEGIRDPGLEEGQQDRRGIEQRR